ncbi:MAG: scaffold protein [Microviridae sp. ctnrr37]|nr:MAG: scaffold protein [Microviridae sp. ctnrr37]
MRVQKFFTKGSKTRQEFKQDCDLALLLKKFGKTPEGQRALANATGYAETARFADVSAVPDFRAARDAINAATASFMALPALVRRRFNNDAAEFLDFIQNPANQDEARTLGLCKPAHQDAAEVPKGA